MIVADLIRQAYFTAHVIRENEETIGFRAVQGLQLLNEIIDEWGSIGVNIPFFTTTTLNLVSDVYWYIIPPVAELDEAKIIVSTNVQYPLQIADVHQFSLFNFSFPIARPNAIYLSEEQVVDDDNLPASKVYFYPTPNQAYTAQLIVKKKLQEVLLFDNLDISTIPPRIYRTLRYQLAADIQNIYGTELPQNFYTELETLKEKMVAINPSDNAVQTSDIFHTQRRFKPWGYGPWFNGGF